MMDNSTKFENQDRYNLNFKKDGCKNCSICNPIKPCHDSEICDECFEWLKNGNSDKK